MSGSGVDRVWNEDLLRSIEWRQIVCKNVQVFRRRVAAADTTTAAALCVTAGTATARCDTSSPWPSPLPRPRGRAGDSDATSLPAEEPRPTAADGADSAKEPSKRCGRTKACFRKRLTFTTSPALSASRFASRCFGLGTDARSKLGANTTTALPGSATVTALRLSTQTAIGRTS